VNVIVTCVNVLGSIGAVLFGAALFVSLANIGFDIYLMIEGCCGLYPDACEYQEKFNTTRGNIETTSNLIDQKWLESKNQWAFSPY